MLCFRHPLPPLLPHIPLNLLIRCLLRICLPPLYLFIRFIYRLPHLLVLHISLIRLIRLLRPLRR